MDTKSVSLEDVATAFAIHYRQTETEGERERMLSLASFVGQVMADDMNLFLWRILEIAWFMDQREKEQQDDDES